MGLMLHLRQASGHTLSRMPSATLCLILAGSPLMQTRADSGILRWHVLCRRWGCPRFRLSDCRKSARSPTTTEVQRQLLNTWDTDAKPALGGRKSATSRAGVTRVASLAAQQDGAGRGRGNVEDVHHPFVGAIYQVLAPNQGPRRHERLSQRMQTTCVSGSNCHHLLF